MDNLKISELLSFRSPYMGNSKYTNLYIGINKKSVIPVLLWISLIDKKGIIKQAQR